MKQFFNSLDEMILIVDSKGRILFVNDKLLKKFKITEEKVKGAYIDTALRQENDELSKTIVSFNSITPKIIECIFYIHESEKIHCKVSINREMWYGEEAFFLNIKEKERYSKEDLEMLLDTLPYGMWMKDILGKYIYVNTTHAEIFGIDKESIIGYHDSDFWNEEYCSYYKKTDSEVIHNRRPILDERLVDKPEGNRWFETYKGPILDESGNHGNEKYIL